MKIAYTPLTFAPILKERIWGGQKLQAVLNKPHTDFTAGESWELSSVPGDISTVDQGPLAGQSLNDLIAADPEGILGKKVYADYGAQFPLLFKWIDAREDLSIQLHPNDALAQARHNSFGKTEMWYVKQADPGSRLIVGFKERSSAEEYQSHLAQKTLSDILDAHPVQQGDVYFLETGTVHAIGAGILIAEIQQTSDITYRIYDWDRVDAQGNSRELHIDLALDAINYDKINAHKPYSRTPDHSHEVVHCRYFDTNYIKLEQGLSRQHDGNSFVVYMVVEGALQIGVAGNTYVYSSGQTVLLPAALTQYRLEGHAEVLEIRVPAL